MRIHQDDAFVMVVDIQERLFPHIANNGLLAKNLIKLFTGLKLLDIPFILNEQYKKGLGETLLELREILGEVESYEKVTFSCCQNEPTLEAILKKGKKVAIVAGVETHVCVLQTCLDLLANDIQPVLVVDCIGSRDENDHKVAIQRLTHAGVILTTTESILFELCHSAKNPVFKQISQLVK